MPTIKFWLNPHYGFGGGYLKNSKMADMAAILEIGMEKNLRVLNFHVSRMSAVKFQLNPTYHSRTDVVLRLSASDVSIRVQLFRVYVSFPLMSLMGGVG